jgi:hypothetical protein
VPALPLSNTFEGGTNGVSITAANSGGNSGDPFSAVAGGTRNFSTTQKMHGALSMNLIDPGATSTYGSWTGFGTVTVNTYFRAYMHLSVTPVTNAWYFAVMRDQADLEYGGLTITTAGVIQARNNANGNIASSLGTVAVNIGSWFRIEWRTLPSLTAGEIEWRLYNDPDSSTITETVNSTGNALRADIGGVRWGSKSTAPTGTLYLDDLKVSTVGWIGPATAGTPSYIPSLGRRPVPMIQGPDMDRSGKLRR